MFLPVYKQGTKPFAKAYRELALLYHPITQNVQISYRDRGVINLQSALKDRSCIHEPCPKHASKHHSL